MAKKINGPQMVLANRLDDGRAVFLTRSGSWSPDTALAAYGEDAALDALLAEAAKSAGENLVVDPEAIGAILKNGVAHPAHIKHIMQAKGPSVRADLGYQAGFDWETK